MLTFYYHNTEKKNLGCDFEYALTCDEKIGVWILWALSSTRLKTKDHNPKFPISETYGVKSHPNFRSTY